MTAAQADVEMSLKLLPEPRPAAELTAPAPASSPPPPKARAHRAEELTPFVAWSSEARSARPPELTGAREASLFDGFLNAPEAIVDRLLSPERVPALVVAAAAVTASCAAAYEAALVWGFHLPSARPIAMAPLMILLAEAAAVGPIFAASVLAAARIPLARLGAALLAASATGALLMAALAPAIVVVIGFDREWLGPLSMVAAFLLAASVSGLRLYRLLMGMAERLYQREAGPTARLSPADAERAALVARLACMSVGFTLGLACWTSSSL